jgi:hypothetical protein
MGEETVADKGSVGTVGVRLFDRTVCRWRLGAGGSLSVSCELRVDIIPVALRWVARRSGLVIGIGRGEMVEILPRNLKPSYGGCPGTLRPARINSAKDLSERILEEMEEDGLDHNLDMLIRIYDWTESD